MTGGRKPFKSDGCSGGMSWAWRKILRHPPPWEGACILHDHAYWIAGSRSQRKDADLFLAIRVCKCSWPMMAAIMYYAVRAGGHPWLPFPWRWNFGRPWPQGYTDKQSPPQPEDDI